jgi:hypothetical protein
MSTHSGPGQRAPQAIIPVRPAADLNAAGADGAPVGLLRRTLGKRFPSRRTLGTRFNSRRTLGSRFNSRRTLGSRFPSRRTFGRRFPSRRVLG